MYEYSVLHSINHTIYLLQAHGLCGVSRQWTNEYLYMLHERCQNGKLSQHQSAKKKLVLHLRACRQEKPPTGYAGNPATTRPPLP